MSKKDQLGGGRFGSAQTRPVSARRQAVAEATGVPTTAAPDSRLRTLPLEQLVPTRFNPRRNFGTSEDLKDFGLKLKTKQLQPAVAVTREAYLKLWENEADAVGTHRYVIANGERRYRASQAAGLETLEVIVDDTIAASRATFLDAVLSENNDREDLDPVEQAIGIQTMVDQLGGKAKVAEHYGKSAGWVTQQLYLLKLAPELQELVSAGTLPVRETRDLVKLPVGEQATAWEARLAARVQEKPKPKPIEHTHAPQEQPHPAASETTGFTAVKPPEDRPTEPAHASPPEPSVFYTVN
ncbi:ParB/RepB/Spo0J family partition protein, partial [Streptomyces sp. NPDC001939]